MGFVKDCVKVGVLYFTATAASVAGLVAGSVVIAAATDVISEKSEQFFGRFKKEEKEE